MKLRYTLIIGAFVVVGIVGGVLLRITTTATNSGAQSNGSSLPYGAVTQYPAVDDLAPDQIDLESPKTFPSLTYGIHTFFWWHSMYRSIGLDHMNMMQFTHVRQVFAWRDIEPTLKPEDDPLRYRWVEGDAMVADIRAKGVNIVARLSLAPDWALRPDAGYEAPPFDLQRYANYCGAVATRYGEDIAAYQIWNEPNLAREWADQPPSPAGYVALLADCSAAIRAVDPDAIIITAGLAPTGTRNASAMPDEEFLWRMYEAGLSDHYDILGLHAPGFLYPPDYDPDHPNPNGCIRWRCFRHVEHMRAIQVANGDAHKQVAITEVGWTIDPRPDSIYHWFAVSPDRQGNYLEKAFQYAAKRYRPWLGLMTAIYYPNHAWTEDDEQYWWAIGTSAPLEPIPYGMDGRPAWSALVQMQKISTNPAYAHPPRDEFLNPINR
jgi:polysaccharide biosynthesis protein PslG